MEGLGCLVSFGLSVAPPPRFSRWAIVVAAGMVAPASSWAVPHADDPINTYWGSVGETTGCSGCHTLKSSEGVPFTSYIIGLRPDVPGNESRQRRRECHQSARLHLLPQPHDGGKQDEGRAEPLRRAAFPASGRRKFIGASAYQDTQGEYLSSYGSNTTEEMDCLDCHEETIIAPGGSYMAHNDPPATIPICSRTSRWPVSTTGSAAPVTGAGGLHWKSKGRISG